VALNQSNAPSVEEDLFREAYAYRFFQAVRLLERLSPQRKPVGHGGPARTEVVRFRALHSLSFPPSEIYELERPSEAGAPPTMTVAFMGLTGPSGVLPRHYTEQLLRHEKEAKGPEKYALRDWLDLFNHRLISLFYRAWEKYRFYIPYERGESERPEPDLFTRCLFSLIGMGVPSLRRRLRVSVWEGEDDERHERVLAEVKDLALLYYGGFLAHRPRCAIALAALLEDYFQLPFEVQQFRGQWLRLDPASQSRTGDGPSHNRLGVDAVAGDRVWDVQAKFRVRLGPLPYARFSEFIPDLAPVPERKSFFLLVDLIRLYVGPEFDFDVQLILEREGVPECRLAQRPDYSPRLGWNTWVSSQPLDRDAADTVFDGETVRWLDNPDSAHAD
jgi:type VI secretion system protein ImpH